MASINFNDENGINVSVSSETPIETSLPNIDYIPGYKTAEEERRANELIRQSSESTRQTNESNRQLNESTRQTNESTRQLNEASRQAYIEELEAKVQRGDFNGSDGADGVDGINGADGEDAKINGVNTINIVAGENITLDQQDNTLTINSTGGSGGTSDYEELENKPKINGTELIGDLEPSFFGIASQDEAYQYYSQATTESQEYTNGEISSLELRLPDSYYSKDEYTIPTNTSDLTNDSGFIDDSYHDETKQDSLVSGTNIKTINNQSILGEGNIEIEGGGGGSEEDNVTITKNSEDKIQAVGVIDIKTNNADKFWTGTQAEYNAISEKDENTFYYITDDTSDYENTTNKVTSLDSSSTDDQYPSAKCMYDMIGGMVDYIVESGGDNSTGYYEKWNSGKLVQWGHVQVTTAINVAIGSVYRSSAAQTITFPVSYINQAYKVIFGARAAINSAYAAEMYADRMVCYPIAYSSQTAATRYYFWEAIGFWK